MSDTSSEKSMETIEEILPSKKAKAHKAVAPPSQKAVATVSQPSQEAAVPSSQSKPKPPPSKSAEAKPEWRGTGAVNAKCFESHGKLVSLKELAWDLKRQYGQSRTVKDEHVKALVNSLTLRPPRGPVAVTTWFNESDRRHYVLAGQHIARAVCKIAESRQAQGLELADWHRFVKADVLKYDTSLEDRALVCGADNASSRVVRQTKVSECLTAMFEDPSSRTDLTAAIVKHVEFSGLNFDQDNPVCAALYAGFIFLSGKVLQVR